MTDTYSDLSERLRKEIATEKHITLLNKEAREKREREERERAEKAAADKKAREDAVTAEVEAAIKRRYLSSGATEEMWQKERPRLLSAFREDIALGRQFSADDQARRAFSSEFRKSW